MRAQVNPKRFLIGMMVAMMVILMAGSAWALQAQDLSFEMAVNTKPISGPGKINLTVKVKNLSEQDITEPLSLYDADDKPVTGFFDGGSLYPLKAGEERNWSGEWNVSQAHLDQGRITFSLRFQSSDASGNVTAQSIPASADLDYQAKTAGLQVVRKISPEVLRPDGEVTVVYSFENTGNVKLSNISLRENRTIATKDEKITSLDPGKTAEIKFVKKIGKSADLSSSALIGYYQQGEKKPQSTTVPTVKIPMAKPNLSMELKADKTSVDIGSNVTLTLTMKNAGNVSYEKVLVKDATLGDVFPAFDVPAGETVIKTKELAMHTTAAFKFDINLTDNSGRTQKQTTNEVKVFAYDPDKVLRLTALLTASTENISEIPGDVVFTVIVTNNSNVKASNVKLMHSGQTIQTLGDLAPSQAVTVRRDYSLAQAGRYRFTVEAEDSQKNKQTFESNELSIGYVAPTPVPTQVVVPTLAPLVTFSPPPAEAAGKNLDAGTNTLLILATVFGVLFLASLALFGVASFMRYRQRVQSDQAIDSIELAKKRDFMNPDTYESDEPAPVVAAETVVEPARELPHEKYIRSEAVDTKEEAVEALEDAIEVADDKAALDQAVAEAPQLADDGAWQLTREDDAAATPRRSRAAKHKKRAPLSTDDE